MSKEDPASAGPEQDDGGGERPSSVAKNDGEESSQVLRELFSLLDKNADGVLSRYEWLRALTSPKLAKKIRDVQGLSDFARVGSWTSMFPESGAGVGEEDFVERGSIAAAATAAAAAAAVGGSGGDESKEEAEEEKATEEDQGEPKDDKDKNVAEKTAKRNEMEEPAPKSPTRRITKTLQNMDLDGDGKISKEELTAGLKAAGITKGESLKQVKELYEDDEAKEGGEKKKDSKGLEINELKSKISKLQALRDALGDATKLRKQKELELKKKREEAERLAAETVAKEMAAIDAEEAKRKGEKERMLQEGVDSAKAKMEKAKKEKEEKEQSAVKIQSAFRGKKARGQAEEERERRKEEEQEAAEATAAKEEEEREEQEIKATQIQAQWRSKLARRHMLERKASVEERREAAATAIQCAYRRYKATGVSFCQLHAVLDVLSPPIYLSVCLSIYLHIYISISPPPSPLYLYVCLTTHHSAWPS